MSVVGSDGSIGAAVHSGLLQGAVSYSINSEALFLPTMVCTVRAVPVSLEIQRHIEPLVVHSGNSFNKMRIAWATMDLLRQVLSLAGHLNTVATLMMR